jgi:hypothetical protein
MHVSMFYLGIVLVAAALVAGVGGALLVIAIEAMRWLLGLG